MKKHIRFSLVTIAAIITALALTAFATAGFVGGIVDWNGNVSPLPNGAGTVNPTPAPLPAGNSAGNTVPLFEKADADSTPAKNSPAAVYDKLNALLTDVPDYEFWTASDGGTTMEKWGGGALRLASVPEIYEAVSGLGVRGPVAPEGYTEEYAAVFYDFLQLDTKLYDKTEREGITLEKYRVIPPDDGKINAYNALFLNSEGQRIGVSCSIYFDSQRNYAPENFEVNEGESFETLHVSGFEKVIRIRRTDGETEIHLLEALEDGKELYYTLTSNGALDDEKILSVIGAGMVGEGN